MAIGGPFRELGGFLDECERGERNVDGVHLTDPDDRDREVPLAAEVEVSLDPSDASGRATTDLCSPRLGRDGTLRFALEPTRHLVPAEGYDVDVELKRATVDSAGRISATISVTPSTPDDGAGVGLREAERKPSEPTADDRRAGDETVGDRKEGGEMGDERKVVDQTMGDDEVGITTAVTRDEGGDDGRGVPPFKDPELLATVYERCDTFAEMAEAIEMDVTAETVRRYMIDYDIHHPDSYRTGDDGADADDATRDAGAGKGARSTVGDGGSGPDTGPAEESPPGGRSRGGSGGDRAGVGSVSADTGGEEQVVLSDGIGLPEDITVETLIDSVERSNTIYEVTQDVGLDRQAALEMLQDLNLLDLVMGRLATEAKRDITRQDVVERLREASIEQ